MEEATASVVWSFQTDIQHKGAADWLAAHTSFCLPLHHYEGAITINSNELTLKGVHKSTSEASVVVVKPADIVDVCLGFDECYTKWDDRSLGLTFKPLRLHIRRSGEEFIVYLVVDFVRWKRTSANAAWAQLIGTFCGKATEVRSSGSPRRGSSSAIGREFEPAHKGVVHRTACAAISGE